MDNCQWVINQIPKGHSRGITIGAMDFISWLQSELDTRGWEQGEIAKRAQAGGFTLSATQVSRILNGTREAGPDACIAIAYALGLPREEVFRARGWLRRTAEQTFPPGTKQEYIALIEGLERLPIEAHEPALHALREVIASFAAVTGVELPDDDSERIRHRARVVDYLRRELPEIYEAALQGLAKSDAPPVGKPPASRGKPAPERR
jgi:transcriptional regulator with XRE-family HTH domain